MCPLWPLHVIIMYLCMLVPLWMVSCAAVVKAADTLPFEFSPEELLVQMEETKQVSVSTAEESVLQEEWTVHTGDSGLLRWNDSALLFTEISDGNWTAMFNLTGNFLGKTSVKLEGSRGHFSQDYPVVVIREKRAIDTAFTYSVAILVAVIYINFGCLLDWKFLRQTIKRPVGPAIGFACQFLAMPLISYGLGKAIFPGQYEMQLGLFFTGLSPAGGASNIWSVALDANVNLSVTMTTISLIASFAMIPFWCFTLGNEIFYKARMATPYQSIAEYVFTLIVPLGIGYLIQRYLPRVCKVLVFLLKPFSAFLILFIVIFAVVTNLYLFQLFTWQIAVAGLGLPWLGYMAGLLIALAFRQPYEDVLAIAVETGIQNTGITVFMLRFALDQPAADLTTVMPVAVSIMTPVPLLILFIILRIRKRGKGKVDLATVEDKAELNPTDTVNAHYILHQ